MTPSNSTLVLEHRVERGPADLRELRDLRLGDASLERLGRERLDRGSLFGRFRLGGGATPAVTGKCFTDLVHESSVNHLTDRRKDCKVLSMVAKFNSKCQDRCGLQIHAGHDEIEPGHFGFHHVDCDKARIEAQIRDKVAQGWSDDQIWPWLDASQELDIQQKIDGIFYATRKCAA